MITIKNVRMLDDKVTDYTIDSKKEHTIEARGKLLLLPGLIDPHICLGPVENRNWESTLTSAIRGGITSVIEIPSSDFPSHHKENLEQKKAAVEKKLMKLQTPMQYMMYARADREQVDRIGLAKGLIKGLVIILDPHKKEELDDSWERTFQVAASLDIPVIVNSDNENTRKEFAWGTESYLEKAIYYAERQSTMLYILNVATQQEIDLIESARKRSLLIYAETTLEHLFQNEALWSALNKGVIETIGSGYHAEAQMKDRLVLQGTNFSLLDPAFLLPFLLTACNEKKFTIDKLVQMSRFNPQEILRLEKNHDAVLVDMEKEVSIEKIVNGRSMHVKLRGWPIYTIVQGEIFSPPASGYHLLHP